MNTKRKDNNFKNYIFAEKALLIHSINEATAHGPLKVVDVIFFPDFKHSPMVRIDGTDMSINIARKIEANLPNVLVRLPRKAGEPAEGDLSKLVEWAGTQDPYNPSISNEEMIVLAQDFLKNHDVDLENKIIWEIESHDDDIVIRIISDNDSSEKEVQEFDGVRIEYIANLDREKATALLKVFDVAKLKGELFFSFLESLLNTD